MSSPIQSTTITPPAPTADPVATTATTPRVNPAGLGSTRRPSSRAGLTNETDPSALGLPEFGGSVSLSHPTPPRVTTDVRGPLDFGVTASGGSQADCFGAIIDQLRAMRDAGQIGDGACDPRVTGVGPAEGMVAA